MLKVLRAPHVWNDCVWWRFEDHKTLTRTNTLIANIRHSRNEETSKPEPLHYEYTDFWSRRTDGRNKLIYCINEGTVGIVACHLHYGQ